MAAVLLSAASVGSASAQSFADLLEAGRYEEAAASLQNAAPEEAHAGATEIFEQAYLLEFQRGRFTDAARAFAAAKRAPHLEEPVREMLDFWQGMALFASVRDSALSDEQAVAVLEEARALLLASGDYPRRVNMPGAASNVERLLELSGRARARG